METPSKDVNANIRIETIIPQISVAAAHDFLAG